MTSIYRRIRIFCFCFVVLPFVNCLTLNLWQTHQTISFYDYKRPSMSKMKILQKKNHPILEISYTMKGENKLQRYCTPQPETNAAQSEEYSYDIINRTLNEECEFKSGESHSSIRVENAQKKLFFYDLGKAIHLRDNHHIDLIIYRGTHIRKKISDIKEAWFNSYDGLCIADSKNRTLAIDCSKVEEDGGNNFRDRRVCTQTEADCSKQSNTKLLTVSEIPQTPPIYFVTIPEPFAYSQRSASAYYAVWSASTQTSSQILYITFNPRSRSISPTNIIYYGLGYLLYPFTIVADVVSAPFVLAYIIYLFNKHSYVP
ncbi:MULTISPECIES: hypothetical protein [Leptospira]|uniref:Lipoprotein n=3 Tax=Leptospira borgpetersenii TaxID=174 RepID=A0ABN0HWY1_LEPBO|nr:hypothetical protein [Leptospira borgpetersenii]EMK08341.1 hypothetical protein LEP1GSC066_1293 [Leptospira sp. serovar Kenya str. Sh9]PTM49412.1 hypothetical protein CLV95_10392 [Leptospira borgpetersenii serovar Javanica]EKP13255.1 hypothetical protein LEP1GSC128_3078 [Leptospira borgpetersenii str. 200801926]EKQ92011.1 hypothetical protein LEP1GSC101_3345 [Leptospira borgpetersenii str. UI 09149]EMN11843.1 hypothetical protein LEP1GSC055_2448 [Leptospira borgpetersenii str. Brem 307]